MRSWWLRDEEEAWHLFVIVDKQPATRVSWFTPRPSQRPRPSHLNQCKDMTRSPSPHASRADLLVVRTRDPNGLKNIDDPNDATTLVGFLSKPTIAAILVFSFEGGVCTSALWIPFKARRGAVVAPRTIARRKPHTSQHLAVSLAGHRRREFELSPSFIPNIPPSDPCSLARRLPSSGVEVQDTLLNGTEQSTRSTFTANLVGK